MKSSNRNLWNVVSGILTCLLLSLVAGMAVAQNGNTLPPGVVAAQGGVQVTLKDIDAYADQMPKKDRAGFFDSPKRIESVIMNLLLKRQLTAQAHAAKIDSDPNVVRQIQLATEDTLARVQLEHYRDNLKQPAFDELAHEYYLSHQDEFVIPGKVKVKHVLVSTKQRSDDEAKARIGEVEAAARAHPDQFDTLVEKYSDDPSVNDNHGVIDDAASGRMVTPFAKAAAALKKPGEISPVVKTEYGYHVLKLISREADKQKSFADVRAGLIAKLRDNWIERQIAEYTGKLRGNPLSANPDLVASLRTRYVTPGTVLPEQAAREAKKNAANAKAAKPHP